MHWPRGQTVKGQGHTATKTVTVALLLVTRAATAFDGVGAHVDSTAHVFLLLYNVRLPLAFTYICIPTARFKNPALPSPRGDNCT